MTDVTAVPTLEVKRYLGLWYEICRLPLKWEDEQATDITAHYTLNETGTIRVDNRCFDAAGKPAHAVGEATPIDETNSKLKVTFLPKGLRWLPFTDGDYWVLKIDAAYSTTLVGTPDRKHLWLLSRYPNIADDVYSDYLSAAIKQGFDISRLITPKHTGREVTDALIAGHTD